MWCSGAEGQQVRKDKSGGLQSSLEEVLLSLLEGRDVC
jgi:hypothetical protein